MYTTHTELDGLCSSSKRKKLFHAMSACVQNCFIKIEKLNYRVRVYAIQFRALSYIHTIVRHERYACCAAIVLVYN